MLQRVQIASFRLAVTSIATLFSAIFVLGCTNSTTATIESTTSDNNSSSQRIVIREPKQSTARENRDIVPRRISSSKILEGYYWMGHTDEGLEVKGRRYRYYDEGGARQWQAISELTYIKQGVVFDGNNYWCLSSLSPENRVGSCSASGWQVTDSSDRQQVAAKIDESELSIGGISLGATEAAIQDNLGAPSRIIDDGYSEIELEYSGLTIILDRENRRAIGMKSTSDRYCTPAGVCPSLRFSAVRQIYGTPEEVNRDEGRFIEYYSPGSTCWLQISLGNADRVESVAVACQP